jgi:hypothetical protein
MVRVVAEQTVKDFGWFRFRTRYLEGCNPRPQTVARIPVERAQDIDSPARETVPEE